MTAVMDYFNLWKWVEEEINGTSEQEPSPAKIKPSNTSENNSYSPDPEIQRLISELENSQETSLKTIIKPYEEKRDYYAKLNNLIGLNGVKDALDKQIAAFRFQKERCLSTASSWVIREQARQRWRENWQVFFDAKDCSKADITWKLRLRILLVHISA